MESKTFTVPTMTCGGCAGNVKSTVEQIAGVQDVFTDLRTQQVTVDWQQPATWQDIASALTEIGYAPAEG